MDTNRSVAASRRVGTTDPGVGGDWPTATGHPPLTPDALKALLRRPTPRQVAGAFVDATLASAARATGHDCQWWSVAGFADVLCFFRLDDGAGGRQIGYLLACVPHRRDEPGAAQFLRDIRADHGAVAEVLFADEYGQEGGDAR